MKKLIAWLFICFSTIAYADNSTIRTNTAGGNDVTTTTNAAATAITSPIFQGAQASPVIGFPGLPSSAQPQLFPGMPVPSILLFGQLLQVTSQFGDTIISGEHDVTQVTHEGENATVVLATSPAFLRYQGGTDNADRTLTARFASKYIGKVTLLGTIQVSSKEGKILLPPADKQYVWKALVNASSPSLKQVLVVPVPNSAGVTIGVRSDGNAVGISGVLSKIASVFLGIGPSYTSQNGSTMPTGIWSQQYLVFEEDEAGIPFSIDMVTPLAQQKAATLPVEPKVDQVAVARTAAIAQAQSLADALAKARLALTITVPTDRVVTERVSCKTEEFTDAKGNVVRMCRGPTNGSYGTTKVIRETATGQSTVDYGSSKK